MFDTLTIFSQTLSDIEAVKELKQTRNIADDNLFGGLRFNIYMSSFQESKKTG